MLAIPASEIGEDASSANLPDWDSVAHLNIIMAVEEAFGVTFEPDEMLEMHSLKIIQAEVAKKLGSNPD